MNTAVVSTDNGFLVLEQPYPMTGEGSSRLEREGLLVETTRDGSHCELSINGTKVLELKLAGSVPVIYFGGEGLEPEILMVMKKSMATIQQKSSSQNAEYLLSATATIQ